MNDNHPDPPEQDPRPAEPGTDAEKRADTPPSPYFYGRVVWPLAIRLARQERLHQTTATLRRGQAEERQGLHAEAEESFRQALAIDPRNAVARLELGKVCEREGKTKEALAAYREVVYPSRANGIGTVNTDFTSQLRYILCLARNQMHWEEAAAFYARATERSEYDNAGAALAGCFDVLQPNYPGLQAAAHYLLGVHRPTFTEPDPNEQREHLQAAIAIRPAWALAHLGYARSLQQAGQLEQAREEYEKAVSLDEGEVRAEAQKALGLLRWRSASAPPDGGAAR